MVLPWLAAAWVLGIAIGPAASFSSWQWITLSVVAVAAAWFTRRAPRLGWSFLALAFIFLGALRSSAAERARAEASITGFIRTAETLEVRGTVGRAPGAWGDRFAFSLLSQSVLNTATGTEAPAAGVVLVVSPSRPSLQRGATAVVRGHLGRPTSLGAVSSSALLEAQSIRQVAPPPRLHPVVLLDGLRRRTVERLHAVLPAPEASLVSGVLLGADETMPEGVRQAFRDTGTAHILAVSGFNVTIVAAAAATVFGSLLGARRGAAAAAAAVLVYTLLCGAEPAVVRAALMAGLTLLALRLGRQSAALAALAAAAILMTLHEPGVLQDVGFQLSFLASLGLIVAGRPCQELIGRWGDRTIRHEAARPAVVLVVEVAALSLIAQIATLPLSAYVFHRLPLTSLPANALILPAQPLLMAVGAATAIASLVAVELGAVVAWLAWPVAAYTIRVAEAFASLPGASLPVPPFATAALVLAYAALAAGNLATRWPRARSAAGAVIRVGGPAWLFLLAVLAAAAWRAATELPDGRLHVTAFPGGEVLIESPTGRFVVLSSGSSAVSLRESLEGRLPLSHRSLDWVILTGAGSSMSATLEALGRHRPRAVILGGGAGTEDGDSLAVGIELVHAVAGMALDLGDQAELEIIDSGPARTIVRLGYGSATILLSDSELVASRSSVASVRPSAVVLLGPGRQVARAVEDEWSFPQPLVVVAAPLPGDPFPEDLGRGSSPPVAATPLQGWIRISTDGSRMWAEAERVP